MRRAGVGPPRSRGTLRSFETRHTLERWCGGGRGFFGGGAGPVWGLGVAQGREQERRWERAESSIFSVARWAPGKLMARSHTAFLARKTKIEMKCKTTNQPTESENRLHCNQPRLREVSGKFILGIIPAHGGNNGRAQVRSRWICPGPKHPGACSSYPQTNNGRASSISSRAWWRYNE